MADRAAWEDLYLIQQNTDSLTSLTEKPDWATATDIGVEGIGGGSTGKFVLLLENRPSFDPPGMLQEMDLTTGLSSKHTNEFEITTYEAPTVTLEGRANSYIMSLLFWSLFQNGCSETQNTDSCDFVAEPYTSPTPEMYFSLVRVMAARSATCNTDTLSIMLTGCIVRSITLTAEERGIVKYSAEVVAASHAKVSSDVGPAAAYSTLAYPAQNTSWKWQNFTVTCNATTTYTPNLNVTFTNNVVPLFYDSATVYGYRLGKCEVGGTLRVPWGTSTEGANQMLTNYKAGTDFNISYNSGTITTANNVNIEFNAIITEPPEITEEPEIISDVTFKGAYDGTNSAIHIEMTYLDTVLIRSIT